MDKRKAWREQEQRLVEGWNLAAGAVLFAAIGALCVGLVVFLPRVV